MTDLFRLGALDLLEGYSMRAFSPVEVVDALADRIEAVEPTLKAFMATSLDRARVEAQAAERAHSTGQPRPLEGVPVAVKDLFDTEGIVTTYGSPMFRDNVPTQDAEAVRRVRTQGGIVIGKTATHEFAWGISGYNAHFDSGRNPWAFDRVSGGSSCGSGQAIAAFEAPLALGTDTGGSIRAPSAFCGIVGLKPTHSLVSLNGVFPLAPSFDHVGPMARSPADAAVLFSVLTEASPFSPGIRRPELLAALRMGVAGLRVGVCPDMTLLPLTEPVRAALDNAAETLRGAGMEIVEVRMPLAAEILPTYTPIQRLEGLEVHRSRGLWPDRRDEYGADLRSRFEGAEAYGLSDYLAATEARERIRAAFLRLFRKVDVLLTPVCAGPPIERGKDELELDGRMVTFRDFVMTYTAPQDLVGLPACAVRAGFDDLGIPIGLQLTGPPGQELTALRAANAFFEATSGLQERWPELP
jgi:aspartyl-tRNA(Asn)/glutamyl-tRNA(Gln) amidotransferase subunit A